MTDLGNAYICYVLLFADHKGSVHDENLSCGPCTVRVRKGLMALLRVLRKTEGSLYLICIFCLCRVE